MTVFESLCRYYEARNAVRAEYDSLTYAQRHGTARSERIRRIRAERACYAMQRKVHIDRMGLTPVEARALEPSVFALHMDRHRKLESVAVRGAF